MDWLPLISTALGAVIALSGSLLVTARTGNDQLEREREANQRRTYIDFATALDAAHAGLRAVIREPAPVQDRRARALAAIGDAGLFRVREQLLIFGAESVVIAGEAAFHALGRVRDVAETDADLSSVPYHDAYHGFARELWTFRMVVRADLGQRGFKPTEFGHAAWDERQECAVCRGAA